MESPAKIKTKLAIQKRIGYFIVVIFFAYVIGAIVFWGIGEDLQKKKLMFRDASTVAGYALTSDDFVGELVDFYNIYNFPKWVYLGLLKKHALVTVVITLIIISIVISMCTIPNKVGMNTAPAMEAEEKRAAEVSLSELVKLNKEFTDLIILDLEGKTKEDILLGIATFAKNRGLVKDGKFLYESFLDKEKLGTSGIGNGVALPEASFIEMRRPYALILCRTKQPVDFACLDRKPVRIVLACLKRDNVDLLGLKPMFYILRMLRSDEYRHKFLDVRTENDIYRLWKELTSSQ